MKKRTGDTLVEVALAVGIFSMVGVAVVSVMVSSTSSAQTALETTLAREEIDAQAESLRFIHSAYLSNTDASSNGYAKLWKLITNNAVTSDFYYSELSEYSPKTCEEAFSSEVFQKYGFIINPRALSTMNSKTTNNNILKTIYISYKNKRNKFATASTYPRLIFENDDGGLVDGSSDTLYRAEGIYIIAAEDDGSTTIIGNNKNTGVGFYDFYIRTCWYGAGANTPSTISTIIRLYKPAS